MQAKTVREYPACIQALKDAIQGNDVLKDLSNRAVQRNANMLAAHQSTPDAPIPRRRNLDALLDAFNALLHEAPQFIDDDLVGPPFSAVMLAIDATLSGSALLRLPLFNQQMKAILQRRALSL